MGVFTTVYETRRSSSSATRRAVPLQLCFGFVAKFEFVLVLANDQGAIFDGQVEAKSLTLTCSLRLSRRDLMDQSGSMKRELDVICDIHRLKVIYLQTNIFE